MAVSIQDFIIVNPDLRSGRPIIRETKEKHTNQ